MAMAASRKPPPNQTLLSLVEASKPVVAGVLQFLDKAYPVVAWAFDEANKLWVKLQPYHPQDFFPVAIGLLLAFFGGSLPVTIAAVEAFRICGWDNTKRALLTLHSQFKVALDASRKDDLIDDNRDGVADVKQIDSKTLVSRKVALFLKVTDPNAVNDGIKGLAAGCSAVVATLRLQFAQTITLGVSLGDVFERTADRWLRPVLEKTLPAEYHKWIGVIISYTCRSIAVSIAWWCTRVISAMHSATRGAQLVMQGIVILAARFRIHLPLDLSPENPLFPIVCGTLAGVGLYSQVARGFGLPFPFNILLLPFRILEWLLFYALSYGKM